MVEFEDITNEIARLIKEDTDLQQYCTDNLGGTLNIIDNTNFADDYEEECPVCAINKGQESIASNNRSSEIKRKQTWNASVTIFADFKGDVTNDDMVLPNGAVQTINGIKTNMPANFVRVTLRKIHKLIETKVGCGSKTEGVLLYDSEIETDDYYADESGVVGGILTLELYRINSIYE